MISGYVSDGTAITVFPAASAGMTSDKNPSSGTWVGQMMPTVPIGIICPREAPLLGFLSLVMPVIALGNTAIVVPSETYPLITGDLYQLFDTSDLPDGAVNIVTGYSSQLLKTLAEHDDVDAIWCFGDEANAAAAKSYSIGNLKQVFTNEGRAIDWFDAKQAEGRWFLQHATQVKNIWVPYGE